MSEHFRFQVEPDLSRITATLSGFWNEQDVLAYRQALADARLALTKAGKPPAHQRFLLDLTQAEVQSQVVINELQQLARDPEILNGRIAIVAPASLTRMQAKRATQAKQVDFFTSTDAASDWLDCVN